MYPKSNHSPSTHPVSRLLRLDYFSSSRPEQIKKGDEGTREPPLPPWCRRRRDVARLWRSPPETISQWEQLLASWDLPFRAAWRRPRRAWFTRRRFKTILFLKDHRVGAAVFSSSQPHGKVRPCPLQAHRHLAHHIRRVKCFGFWQPCDQNKKNVLLLSSVGWCATTQPKRNIKAPSPPPLPSLKTIESYSCLTLPWIEHSPDQRTLSGTSWML